MPKLKRYRVYIGSTCIWSGPAVDAKDAAAKAKKQLLLRKDVEKKITRIEEGK